MTKQIDDLIDEVIESCQITGHNPHRAIDVYLSSKQQYLTDNHIGLLHGAEMIRHLQESHVYGLSMMRDYIWFDD